MDPPTSREILDVLFLVNYNTRLVVLGTALLGIAAGLVGTFLLLRKRSLMGDALSHATLPGIAIAFATMVAFGGSGRFLPGLLVGATLSGVAGILTMLFIRHTTRLRDDVAMGFVLSVFFGVGIAALQMAQSLPGASAAGLESFIYGKAAGMLLSDFLLILGVTVGASLLLVALAKEFLLLCFDDAYAASQGWPAMGLDMLLLALVTAVTVIGLQAVGLILVIAFLVIPPTAARFWTERLGAMLPLSAAIGGGSGWLGASVSALAPDLPTGALIVLVATGFFLVGLVFAPARGIVPRLARQARLRRKTDRQHLLRAAYELLEARCLAGDGQSKSQIEGESPAPARHDIANVPFPLAELAAKRSWSPRQLRRILRIARAEDHLEPCGGGMLRLSESGFGEAARTTRNHRLWETYLIHHADIAPSHVDRDADAVEHVLGAELVRELEILLGHGAGAPPVPPSPHRIGGPAPQA